MKRTLLERNAHDSITNKEAKKAFVIFVAIFWNGWSIHNFMIYRAAWDSGSAHLSAPPWCQPQRGPGFPQRCLQREEPRLPHEGTAQMWILYFQMTSADSGET